MQRSGSLSADKVTSLERCFPKQTEGTIPLEGHVTQRCVQGPDVLHVNVTASVTPTDIQIQQRPLVGIRADACVHQSRTSSPSFCGANPSRCNRNAAYVDVQFNLILPG